MEDEERRRKLEAGKAKLAEYRQRKSQSDGQKKKKKKTNKGSEQQEGEQEVSGERKELPATELSFSRTLRSGETVKHDQTYTIEPESEISTTAEDYSSEVNGHEMAEKSLDVGEEELYAPSRLQEMEDELAAKNMAVEELSRELEEIRATFGVEGVQQLQDFEAALKQRDGIITQLTANLQQARAEKDEVMREFLDLTEKSQKLQIQFQQLQAGESLRSSSISSAAADLLQARQQVLLYQQQLDERDTMVKSLQMQLEKRDGKLRGLQEQLEDRDGNVSSLQMQLADRDGEIKGLCQQTEEMEGKVKCLHEQLQESEAKVSSLQERMLQMTQIQQRMSELETVGGLYHQSPFKLVSRNTEESFTQRFQEKDLRIEEQERLILEHQQSLSQLRDNLQESEKRFINISEQLEAKVCDLEGCEAELQASKEKERLSSGEILQLMGTVEALQKRYHQGSQSECEVLQRAEQDATRRLDHLRAELDEMYGQQIVQMKQELLSRHTEEMANTLNQHSTELKMVLDQHRNDIERLTSQLTQSTGEVNVLNVRVIELQQRLQEMQVLREKAEHDLTQTSQENIFLQKQVQQLMENLRLKDQEKSQSEVHLQLHSTITDLQAQLASVQETSSELEAKHESEITNYRIKLEMLEREKDAVLDRMAESQEAELERLRTQLLFSHEEELSRLREDLQHESQMNVGNLRDELNQRHEETVQQLRNGYEERMRVAEDERSVLAAEKTSLLQEIATLKNDLSQALEKSRVEELVSQLKELQAEIQELRQRQSEKVETDGVLCKNELTRESEQSWEEINTENKHLKERNASLTEELKSLEEDHKMLVKKMDTLISENRQVNEMAEELKAEIERQKSTFSFAEKNFEVNYQELRAEMEERLREQTLQYETNLQGLETQLQNLKSETEHGSIQSLKEEDEEPDGGALVEKHTTELMEKLQRVELEKAGLVKQVEQKETEIKNMKLESAKLVDQIKSREVELRQVEQEKTGLFEQVEKKEEKVKMVEQEKAGLVEQLEQKEVELKRLELERAGLEEQTELKDLALKRVELAKVGLVQQVDLKEAELQQKEAELERMKLENAELVQQVDQKMVVLQQKEAQLEKMKLENAELVQQVDQNEVVLQQKEAELQEIMLEKAELVQQLNQKAVELQQMEAELERMTIEKAELVELQQKEVQLQRMKLGKAELTDQVQVKKAGLKAARKARQKASRVKSLEAKPDTKKQSQLKIQLSEVELQEEEACKTEQLLAPPLSQAAAEEESVRETDVSVVLRSDGVKQKTHARTKIVAAAAAHSHTHTHTHTLTHTLTRTQPATAAATHADRENKPESESEKQVESQYGETDLVPVLTHTDSMEGFEHEECRLQMEAQRISLSQIHAAQLELLKERLPEWEEPGRPGGAKACSPSLTSIAQDCTHLLQLISVICGVDAVDVTDEQLQNLKPSTIREIIDTTRDVYQKLQQLDMDVLSSHTCLTTQSEDRNEMVFDDRSVRTEDDVHTSTLSELQEQLQEEVKHKMEIKEEVKLNMKLELYEEVKQKIELQEEQHRQEIQRLRSYYSEQIRETEERYTNQILLLQDQLQDMTPADTLHSMQSISAHIQEQQLQMRQCEMEEEIARVIVQMSVEFAKQSEMSRISMQNHRERQQDELSEETQVHTLSTQMRINEFNGDYLQEGAEPEQVIHKEEEKGRGGMERLYPSMQCSSTQTEMLRRSGEGDEDKDEERERKKKDEQCEEEEVTVTSAHTEERLYQVLMDMLKMATLIEETIRDQPITPPADMPEMDTSSPLSGATDTDEGLDMSQEAGLAVEGVGSVWSVSSRLQKVVEKLVITLTETQTRLEHARLTQTELMKEKFSHDQQIADLLIRQEELQQRLEEERAAREKLTQQLHHAEGLIDGYSGERRVLEEQVREGMTLQQQLEAELQMTNSQLQELQQERPDFSEQQDLLLRQQDSMTGGATEAELRLLEETEKLMQEKVDVQRQAQKDHAELQEQVKQLEAELDEQVRAMAKLEETHLSESADLRQQIHALEKQLENNRRFLDEQAADREHERDVFQQEIQKLEQQLKSSSKPQADHREVEELSVALQEKSDWCSELLLRVEQLQRDVQERDEEIERQEERVRMLEEVLVSHDNRNITPTREDSKQYASMAGGADATLEALLQTEREALDRKEKEIVNLEEQLEQFRDELQNKSEEVQQLHMQLEIQRKEISTQQQDLQAHTSLKMVLEEKNRQIALLNEQIAKLQLSETTKPDNKEVEVKNELVRELESQVEYLRGEQDRLKRDNEEEVEQLNSVIEKLQQELSKIEHKQSAEDDEEDQHDELKQKMDQIQRELDTLKEDHSSLLSKYGSLQEERETEEEKEKKNEMLVLELEDMLREKTAALLVAQVQIHALEESATFTVTNLTKRVEMLENFLEERELELTDCRSEVDKAQSETGTLHLKVSQLEEKLKEKVATLSQLEHLETNIQTKEFESKIKSGTFLDDIEKKLELKVEHGEYLGQPVAGKEIGLKQQCEIEVDQKNDGKELESKVIAGEKIESKVVEPTAGLMESSSEMEVKQRSVNTVENMVLLMEKLRELEVELSSMSKTQELQKHLLAGSEEEVEEYEKMLTKLMDLLDQIKTTPTSPAATSSEFMSEMEKLIQELQEVKDQSEASKEELDRFRNQSQNLQDQIQLKEELIEKLQEDLHRLSAASDCSSEKNSTVVSALRQELHEVKGQAEATEEELNRCKEISQRLQEQIQEREMTIALLKDQVHKATGDVESSELLQELQEVKHEAAAIKEELSSYIERSLKLQEQIQVRDATIAQLMEEIQQLRTALTKSGEEKDLASSKKKTGRDHTGKVKGGSTAKDKQSLSTKNSTTPPLTPSANGSTSVSTVDVGTQVEGAGPAVELGAELEEVIGEYTERIGQIRDLHAAEIMDMENRHIAESESLKKENQRLEQECDTLRDSINKLRPIQVVRPDPSVSSPFRDGYTSDSSSEVGTEFRNTPEGARPDDTHLPDKIKALLREVHQEGMQVLSLSELSVCDDSADRGSLLAQITHLQAQLTQLQQDTHTNQQLPHTLSMTEKQTGERDRETEECERLKAELAQVKLELKTSQKTQHTHLRELDTLRAEVCVKASELDAASDRLAEEQRRARELQWEVERERSRADRRAEGEREALEDVRLALEEERQVSAQREAELSKYMALATQLQVQLESQNRQINELSSDLQKEKEFNAELLKHTQHPLQVEDGIPSVADNVLQSLQAQLKEKQATLVELRAQAEQRVLQELEQKQKWQDERTLLQRRIDELQSLFQGERERGKGIEREKERLECRVVELMEKSSTNLSSPNERMGDWMLEQKSNKTVPLDSISIPFLNTAGATDIKDMDSAIAKLQQMSSQINRLTVEGADRESFSWLQRNVQDILSFLQKFSSAPPAGPESFALTTGGFSSVLTERLLRQNAELTGYISRLTEEKNELRNQILRLEEELRRLRHLKAHSSLRSGSEVLEGVSEVQRELWMREKSRMEKSLRQAEVEISRLRAEIRSDTVRDLSTVDADNATLKCNSAHSVQRIYGKYLRSESFRKALIYQKKYLLLLLGGFQECEEATLALIAGMTGPHVYTHTTLLECVSHRHRGYTRFRSAARVCIAIFRMRFLVRRWQKVTGGSITISRNGVGQSPVMEVRNDSPYLQPYGERRGTNRGRTGRESPHTAHSTQHRYGGMSTDGGVLCSHLQNYDPDRALSDYITRLEALQRRLGSVQSGSSSYAQLHFGMRR
ncbi:A-kinase anchor protein 9 isoform X5 [Ictalurus furcatus]|uniref:A-kinase anchor protein 9 isoform X5 n=1 Tax=Ictalurus furcatus TaxID=66913 RepID=UPI002350AB84|nr:A-kinase anchor protein 9 isoform X5 [Ictalurus furcatus]